MLNNYYMNNISASLGIGMICSALAPHLSDQEFTFFIIGFFNFGLA